MIRKVTASTGIINRVAGKRPTGTPALITTYPGNQGDGESVSFGDVGLNAPKGITADNLGNIYFVDYGNDRIRTIDVINGGSAVINAVVSGTSIKGLAMLGNNDLYYSDLHYIKKYDIGLGTASNFAGTGVSGYSGDGGAPLSAQLANPNGVVAISANEIYISDFGNGRIRKI